MAFGQPESGAPVTPVHCEVTQRRVALAQRRVQHRPGLDSGAAVSGGPARLFREVGQHEQSALLREEPDHLAAGCLAGNEGRYSAARMHDEAFAAPRGRQQRDRRIGLGQQQRCAHRMFDLL